MPNQGQGPRDTLDLGDHHLTLVGTAHVSRDSADEVRELIQSGEFDAVAIELCASRHQSLVDPDAIARLDLFQVLRQGKAGMVAASLALSAFQQRVAEQSGIEPGADMKAAVEEAQHADLPLYLIDREIGVTLKRVYRNVPWYRRMTLISGIVGSVLSRQKVSSEEIERLKEGDVLESTFTEFAQQSRHLYTPLIEERDRYMALKLLETLPDGDTRRVLVVIGAGHLKGMSTHLRQLNTETPTPSAVTDERQTLDTLAPSGRLLKLLPWLVVALVVAGFAMGFSRDTGLGWSLVGEWVLINSTLSALGALIALGHPLTILAAFVAAPLTSLNPTIGVGFVTAGVELYMRKPTVGDFSTLRHDVSHWRGWWRNRVARTLLVFLLSTAGSAAATWIAGLRIAGQLFG
ncbi:TraB/GumN family protein [Kushneria indalinina]|uniref:Pheromone shutdown-related protein TraB n=1 Tax=Kushneria indalinina DSM 14324 TaxID=1122140 RepID=A0A3D9DSZ7_9GAMM|nr:TraB/GumN family protein [Kushneria indalinina]REC93534.1 pheromone shutdown-related protein TraB [Kushneria indalinina DSM 14324]